MHNRLKTARPVARLVQGKTDWYRITDKLEAKDGGGSYAEVFIYDEIGYFGVTASDFTSEIRAITAPKIELHLNTPGGDVFDGVAIYQALKDHPAHVTTYVDSLAASAGSFIAQAGDHIVMKPNASMMIHDAHSLGVGNAKDMRDLADLMDKMSNNIASMYAERAGGTVEEWRTAMQAETWYNAEEAVAAGLADVVGGSSTKQETDTTNKWDLSIFNYEGREKAPTPQLVAKTEDAGPDLLEEFRRSLRRLA